MKPRTQTWFSPATIAWLSAWAVLAISFLALAGWIFNITFLKSIESGWISMSPITSVCLVLSASQLIILLKNPSGLRNSIVLWTPGAIAGLLGVLVMALYCIREISQWEPSAGNAPFLYPFWIPGNRMAIITATIFVICACALSLLATGKRREGGIAHGLMLPAVFVSYLIPLSYLLGVQTLHGLLQTPVALNTGLAFCALCVGILCAKPDTWLMDVITSQRAGGIMARRFLPALLLIPIIIGWLRLYGERVGAFQSDVGVVLVAMTYTACLLCLLWINARVANLSDRELVQARDNLEMRVHEKTKELDIERKKLEDVLENLPAFVCLLTEDYHVSFANRIHRELFGVSNGRRCFDYVLGRNEPCENCESFKTLKTGAPHRWEFTAPNGRSYNLYDLPFKRTDGPNLVLEMGIDITAQKAAQAELEKYRDHLETLVKERTQDLLKSGERLKKAEQIAGLGSWELDLEKNRLEWSDETYRIFGLKPQEFEATYEAFLQSVHPDDRDAVDEAYSGSLKQGKDSYAINHRVIRKDTGEVRYVQEKCEHVRDGSGKIVRSIGMVLDITDIKLAEETIRKTMADLDRSNRELEQFAYVASHDLRAPLGHIEGFSQLLEKRLGDRLDPTEEDYFRRIRSNSQKMLQLIESLLKLSRITRQEIKRDEVDMGALAAKIGREFGEREPFRMVKFTVGEGLKANGDAALLRSLLDNLIGNAWKYSSKNPDAQIEFGSAGSDGGKAFFVKDNGAGFDPAYAAKLFLPFQRLHRDEEFAGHGIGLATAQRIVSKHGGRIWAEGSVGKGATFYFTLGASGDGDETVKTPVLEKKPV